VSKGGNYLLNVGPTGQGVIPQGAVNDLQQIGAWMKVNGQAIYGTTASPFHRQLPWGRCTKKVNWIPRGAVSPKHDSLVDQSQSTRTLLYLHVFDWPQDGKLLVPGLRNNVESATLLANGRKLAATGSPEGVVVWLPAAAPDPISSTVVLRINEKLQIHD